MTAEEFLTSVEGREVRDKLNQVSFLKADAELLRRFSRYHCEQQLKAILEKAEIVNEGTYGGDGQVMDDYVIDRDSITNAYNLDKEIQ